MCVLYCVGIECCIFIIRRSSYQSTIINIFTGPVSLYDECENYPAYICSLPPIETILDSILNIHYKR